MTKNTQKMIDIEAIKAANHKKSLEWEAKRFSDGDQIWTTFYGHCSGATKDKKTYRFYATREAGAWTDKDTAQRFETISRWGRARITSTYVPGLVCNSYNPKNDSTYLKVGEKYIRVRNVPVKAIKAAAPSNDRIKELLERVKDLKERIQTNEEKIKASDERIQAKEALIKAKEEHIQLIEGLIKASDEQAKVNAAAIKELKERIQAKEEEAKYFNDRLLATATLALMVKDRMEAIEARLQPKPIESSPEVAEANVVELPVELSALDKAREKAMAEVVERAKARAAELRAQA
jgi:DNA repair exonuclease SbcCD ATPase subunit